APAPPELIERAVAALPHVGFVNVFGQTETLGAVTALGPDEHRAGGSGSVGMPLPGVEIRIVDPETGNHGDEGELWVRAPHTVEEGWVRTGDLVRRDPDGRLHATGRLSDGINRGGEKISPFEIEQAIRGHAAVADVAVVGVRDRELGERIAAASVVSASVDADEIRAWCATRLAPYKIPERIRFVDALPRTELGKVSRPAVRALLEEGPRPGKS
ncbi:MAG: class I adenylate-forming enzyme family protein, partial [Actinomycetota bacterium]